MKLKIRCYWNKILQIVYIDVYSKNSKNAYMEFFPFADANCKPLHSALACLNKLFLCFTYVHW